SLVLEAGSPETHTAQKALAEICHLYYHPLYVFAVRTGATPEDAMDLTQGFFEYLLKNEVHTKAHPDRGRLRSFLLASFKNFASTQRRRLSVEKRGGGQEILPLDGGEEADLLPADPDGETPAEAYDRAWALTVVDLVTRKLKEEYSRSGRGDLFRELKEFLL
ncbi:MAG: sigma-70 family RNA polymerase sigma factor, partial [Akkermansiaceae bacterium]|nr:sigma-70 family RNA polymerase sigma factor [Akkermansiaceae bacterium]